MAGALVLRPRMLVLDEPLSQLDAHGARALIELCVELREAGTLLAVAEHRLDDLLPMADSVAGITGGRLDRARAPQALAGALDSAPQVVRLSRAMGWSPLVIDAGGLRPLLAGAAPVAAPRSPAASAAPAWRVDAVTAGHGDLLRDVKAAGAAGEVVAVMGRNGAGKTTLLRVIAGLAAARSGTRVARGRGASPTFPRTPPPSSTARASPQRSRGPCARGGRVTRRLCCALLGVDGHCGS